VKRAREPYPFRRHAKTCRFFGPGGREARLDLCNCPFHVDGVYQGRRVLRRALRTRSRQIAQRRVAEFIQKFDHEPMRSEATPGSEGPQAQKAISEAIDRFLANKSDVERGTHRKYAAHLGFLSPFCTQHGISRLGSVNVDALEDFRRGRKIGPVTWKVERQTLVTFFTYCVKHKWITDNPAKELEAPRNLKPNEIEPYTLAEESQILAACLQIGVGKDNTAGARYEQLRARAMLLLLRNTALRISDVATFRRVAVAWDWQAKTWRVRLRTQKSGEPVYLPIPEDLKLTLDAVPLVRNAAQDRSYYFWNGVTSRRAVVGIAERTLSAVFKKSGIKKAHAHRFRHTLATRLLGQGATFEQVADILGNSPAVVRKHYGKLFQGTTRQHRPADAGAFQDRAYVSSHTSVTRKFGGCKLMKIREVFWCGEGDLFSCALLKAPKLYTLRRARNTKSATRTKSSHIFSHTGPFSVAARSAWRVS
jgi:site-specific recombinase XerD